MNYDFNTRNGGARIDTESAEVEELHDRPADIYETAWLALLALLVLGTLAGAFIFYADQIFGHLPPFPALDSLLERVFGAN